MMGLNNFINYIITKQNFSQKNSSLARLIMKLLEITTKSRMKLELCLR